MYPLAAIKEQRQQAAVVTGWEEKGGIIQVAFANTFFLPPIPESDTFAYPMFSNFRDVLVVNKDELLGATRIAAITHDCRVSLIRRMIYFRYRFNLAFGEVRDLEAARIGADPTFEGPRPAWATAR